ncbi:Glycos_transf_1 domain-containing protein [Cephalotus follicularis]|uniref:Glycos_transf_1 domain-containing protein n=1 Tax=Cephalotus follicularis TaxID=3775 RepID=A0A1Q3B9Z8_CEPFO|nr:Glycos_transf_1 domain-containing protein [Cephalotus follicularis]
MGRNSPPHEVDDNTGANNDISLRSIRDRFPFKRNPSHNREHTKPSCSSDRILPRGSSSRSSLYNNSNRFNRKGILPLFPFRGAYLFYFVVIFAVFAFAMASLVLQTSITSMVFMRGGGGGTERRERSLIQGLRLGSALRFVPSRKLRTVVEGDGLNGVRSNARIGVRPPRLALILGNMKKDARSLMLITVMKNLQKLDYMLTIYAIENGEASSIWEQIANRISILGPERYGHIDWSFFEGVIADSLEAKDAISSLMQDPFGSVPLIWIIQEDTLANRLPMYEEKGWKHLVSSWKSAFSRANVVVFPDFTLPMLYSALDVGNFFVLPGSPIDVWAAESYSMTHSKDQIRKGNGFSEDNMVVVVVGSSFFYKELSWDYAVAMHTIGPLLIKYARRKDAGVSFKFVFLCGNSSDGYNDALQEVASRLGLLHGSLRHYGLNGEVNSMLLMADIVLYGSSQDEQGFPPLILRAMTFGIPVVIPDFPIMKKYVAEGVHGFFYLKHNPDDLMKAFSLLISGGKLSKLAQAVAFSGKLLAKNMLVSECISGYTRLLENVLNFPSAVLLPGHLSQTQLKAWEWNLFMNEIEHKAGNMLDMDENGTNGKSSVVYALEEEANNLLNSTNITANDTELEDIPTERDWDVLREVQSFEEYERLEMEELEGRTERNSGVWDDIYRNARKAEKLKFEANERDEGELERTGQPVCIYEIYSGSGAWPFLHHGSLYRGLSLSTRARRLRSDDVDAVARLPLLNDTYYRDILCEVGGMFSIANRVDNIHKRPWIGFQSWSATGRKASLSIKAEKVLEETIQNSKEDVIYFWARLDIDGGVTGSHDVVTFWSMCDILNGGRCRTAFQDAFRQMYALPSSVEALPPMPEDGGHWSALHSWVMPTPLFLEFIMFTRMFVDSLDALHVNSTKANTCLLGSSKVEQKHCYCMVLELLVNVWAYHGAHKMVYIDPHSGSLEEQHAIEHRKGFIWEKYFNLTLLKRMDEDLAEAADDDDPPTKKWLWPLTGEVHWQGVYEREREQRYRFKMDKKRKTKEKLYDRMRHGYRQKSLG